MFFELNRGSKIQDSRQKNRPFFWWAGVVLKSGGGISKDGYLNYLK
jgi:hypothetical protein